MRVSKSAAINFLLIALLFVASIVLSFSRWPVPRSWFFEKPKNTEIHGRITEKLYYAADYYTVPEENGTPIKTPGDFVEFTRYFEVEGVDAVGFTVLG